MKRFFASVVLVLSIITLLGCKNTDYSSMSKKDQEEIVREINSVKDISEEEKVKIAKDLFDEYINNNRTDWSGSKHQKDPEQPVVAMTDYKINSVKFLSEDKNKFIVCIVYDIKYTDESNWWVAGNGDLEDDNWVRNKMNFVDIEKYLDHYIITNIYTG